MHVLLGDQHGGAGRAELAQKLADPLHDDRRQPFAGLVQQEQRRIAHQRAGDRQHLLLAAGQPPRYAVAQRLQQREDLIDAPDRPLVLAGRAFLLADDEIVLDGVLREDLAVLRHEAESGLGDAVWLHARDHLALQEHPAAPRRREPHDGFHGGGLAGAVAPKQRHGLALAHRQADAKQDLAGAIIDVEILDLDDRLAHACAPARWSVPR
jgi:hypothetical protein